jgi:ferredoxin
MRVIVDQDNCIASGQCVLAGAGVVDQRDEDGIVVLLNNNPPAELHGAVRQAAATCPAWAITVEGVVTGPNQLVIVGAGAAGLTVNSEWIPHSGFITSVVAA